MGVTLILIFLALFLLAVMQGLTLSAQRRLMVNQDRINGTVSRLTAAVDKLVAAQANQTPDATVTAALDAVDAQSARLEAVAPSV
jgi:hypothetical protein